MIHNYLSRETNSDSWGVSKNDTGKVLVQLNQGMEQIRVAMTPEQAQHMADMISQSIKELSLISVLDLYEYVNEMPQEH